MGSGNGGSSGGAHSRFGEHSRFGAGDSRFGTGSGAVSPGRLSSSSGSAAARASASRSAQVLSPTTCTSGTPEGVAASGTSAAAAVPVPSAEAATRGLDTSAFDGVPPGSLLRQPPAAMSEVDCAAQEDEDAAAPNMAITLGAPRGPSRARRCAMDGAPAPARLPPCCFDIRSDDDERAASAASRSDFCGEGEGSGVKT